MIHIAEADQIINKMRGLYHTVFISFDKAEGRVLAENLIADREYPPFSRICMDGIAISSDAWNDGVREFPIQGILRAGVEPFPLLNSKSCIETMTGAPCPKGCDINIRYEDLEIREGVAYVLKDLKLAAGQNIHPQGTDYSEGQVLLKKGIVLNETHIAIAASIGKDSIEVYKVPRICVISTGDELVDVAVKPKFYQIRKSNVYALISALKQNGFYDINQKHLPDDPTEMKSQLEVILAEHDVLIMSGGVSMGKYDFVPTSLTSLGVVEQFHKIRQRPGKPLWVGVGSGEQIVFGLPGNPVSTLVSFRRFLLPLLLSKSGLKKLDARYAILSEDLSFKPKLTYFLPVSIDSLSDGRICATPNPPQGSGDFTTLGVTSGFLELPDDQTEFKAGSAFPFYSWGNIR